MRRTLGSDREWWAFVGTFPGIHDGRSVSRSGTWLQLLSRSESQSIWWLSQQRSVYTKYITYRQHFTSQQIVSFFLFIGSFSMPSFQFTNGPDLLSHFICLCPFHEEISMELCFEKQEDQDMKYQWSKCYWWNIKTSFQRLPKFNFKPAMVERNAILLTSVIPFERSLLPQGLLYLGWDPKIFLQIFFWRKGMAIAQDSPSCLVKRRHNRSVFIRSTTAASYIVAKWRKPYVCFLEVHD